MCSMFFLIPTQSQYIDRVFFVPYAENHLEGFRLSHRGTLAVAYPPVPMVGTLHLTLRVYLRLANRPSAQF
jgi:hypothetical protein